MAKPEEIKQENDIKNSRRSKSRRKPEPQKEIKRPIEEFQDEII
jgi:hypothetical protein